MSTMLEQAIVDAGALKEAALKNAEQLVIEKYAEEIKEAVDVLLEQPEEEELGLGLEEEPMEGEVELSPAAADLPDAATVGEDLCPCPEEEEEIEINWGELEKEIKAAEQEGSVGTPEPHQSLAVKLEEEIEITEDEEDEFSESLEIEEEESLGNLSEEELDDILEKITFDTQVVAHGHAGAPTQAELEYAQSIAKAQEHIDELEKENENLKGLLESIKGESDKYKKTVQQMKEHLTQVNVSNAKLLYTNRVLGSTSLNERQKTKIVEALSKTNSIKETKVIYETLQNAVGTTQKKGPKSLSEAVEKRSVLTLSRRQEKKADDNPVSDRWKKLAGIN